MVIKEDHNYIFTPVFLERQVWIYLQNKGKYVIDNRATVATTEMEVTSTPATHMAETLPFAVVHKQDPYIDLGVGFPKKLPRGNVTAIGMIKGEKPDPNVLVHPVEEYSKSSTRQMWAYRTLYSELLIKSEYPTADKLRCINVVALNSNYAYVEDGRVVSFSKDLQRQIDDYYKDNGISEDTPIPDKAWFGSDADSEGVVCHYYYITSSLPPDPNLSQYQIDKILGELKQTEGTYLSHRLAQDYGYVNIVYDATFRIPDFRIGRSGLTGKKEVWETIEDPTPYRKQEEYIETYTEYYMETTPSGTERKSRQAQRKALRDVEYSGRTIYRSRIVNNQPFTGYLVLATLDDGIDPSGIEMFTSNTIGYVEGQRDKIEYRNSTGFAKPSLSSSSSGKKSYVSTDKTFGLKTLVPTFLPNSIKLDYVTPNMLWYMYPYFTKSVGAISQQISYNSTDRRPSVLDYYMIGVVFGATRQNNNPSAASDPKYEKPFISRPGSVIKRAGVTVLLSVFSVGSENIVISPLKEYVTLSAAREEPKKVVLPLFRIRWEKESPTRITSVYKIRWDAKYDKDTVTYKFYWQSNVPLRDYSKRWILSWDNQRSLKKTLTWHFRSQIAYPELERKKHFYVFTWDILQTKASRNLFHIRWEHELSKSNKGEYVFSWETTLIPPVIIKPYYVHLYNKETGDYSDAVSYDVYSDPSYLQSAVANNELLFYFSNPTRYEIIKFDYNMRPYEGVFMKALPEKLPDSNNLVPERYVYVGNYTIDNIDRQSALSLDVLAGEKQLNEYRSYWVPNDLESLSSSMITLSDNHSQALPLTTNYFRDDHHTDEVELDIVIINDVECCFTQKSNGGSRCSPY